MNTLTISQIFENFQYYKNHYLSILSDAAQYYTPVENAYVTIWPSARQSLYLGDLLQLWLSNKWILNKYKQEPVNSVLRNTVDYKQEYDCFLYVIDGNLLTGKNIAQGWSCSRQKEQQTDVQSLFQFYCVWKSLKRPQIKNNHLKAVV